MKYKIGQILTSNTETIVEKEFSGEKVTIPKGNRIIIGADKLAHHLKGGLIQPLSKDMEVEGYDTAGLAEYIFMYFNSRIRIDDEILGYLYCTREDFIEEIENALLEIGF